VGKIACVISPRIARAILLTHRCTFNARATARRESSLRRTRASARRLPTLRPRTDQKKGRLRVRRRQNLAALGYGRAHAHSILSMALREFCNEIRLYGDCRWEP
jgi:hypothetical protein